MAYNCSMTVKALMHQGTALPRIRQCLQTHIYDHVSCGQLYQIQHQQES